MRLIQIIFLVLIVLMISSAGIVMNHQSPEDLLIGSWQEVAWEYEKTNKNFKANKDINDGQKDEIWENLFMHEGEVWDFDKDKSLVLFSEEQPFKTLLWNVKGRGNILEIIHDKHRIEDYQVRKISEDSLVVHLSLDLQVRGIMKMTFKRIPKIEYAQKI